MFAQAAMAYKTSIGQPIVYRAAGDDVLCTGRGVPVSRVKATERKRKALELLGISPMSSNRSGTAATRSCNSKIRNLATLRQSTFGWSRRQLRPRNTTRSNSMGLAQEKVSELDKTQSFSATLTQCELRHVALAEDDVVSVLRLQATEGTEAPTIFVGSSYYKDNGPVVMPIRHLQTESLPPVAVEHKQMV